jgi:hypothetical protein
MRSMTAGMLGAAIDLPGIGVEQPTALTGLIVIHREFQNLADCRIVVAWVICGTLRVDFS